MTDLPYVKGYFATARERYQINLNRLAGAPWPWTEDKQFQQWRFCQVHREDDKTTVWFRENIRQPLCERWARSTGPEENIWLLKILRATIAFRWFNRIETGEAIKDVLIGKWDSDEIESRLAGVSPVVTGAYIIKGYDGYPKLQGVLKAINEAFPQLPPMLKRWRESILDSDTSRAPYPIVTLEEAWQDLKTLNYMGGFMSYEVVSDLRWTPVLDDAIDIETWANAGPGCARGLSWVIDGKIGRFNTGPGDQKTMLPIMQQILQLSREEEFWPQKWKCWEMREVEHWSCEFDKYCRARSGQQMKRRFPRPDTR